MSSAVTRALRGVAAAGFALGLAVAPAAQIDADVPGAPSVAAPSIPPAGEVDDADPGPRPPASNRPASSTGEPSDQDVVGAPLVTGPHGPSPGAPAGRLEDGRGGDAAPARATPGARVVAEDLLVGRVVGEVSPARRIDVLYGGALHQGRAPSARPSDVVEVDEEPIEALAPGAAAEVAAGELGLAMTGANPVMAQAWVAVTAAASGRVTVTMYDARGRQVVTAFDGPVVAGEVRRVRIDVRDVAVGPYVVVADDGHTRAATTIQVVR